ncbi:head-tail adaptor [Pantoea ananatis]|uniref:head-tail adaptor n=1 Tax=Pantoea ananas TaxID=553 RepID=UPI00188F1573|nr:head-tail adaptor [Pantoea ananatis]
MPTLDVSDVLMSPEFCDTELWYRRNAQTVDADGMASNEVTRQQFAGVVNVDRSLEARRMEAGQVIGGAILVITQTRLISGKTALDADIVEYAGADYRVTFVDPYPRYGAGFVQAHCELQPFDGGANEQ